MRLSLRFILPLAIALAAIAYAVIPLVDRFTLQWFVRDLDMRTTLITNTIQEPLQDLVREGSRAKVRMPELRPVTRDLQALIRDLESERKARDESQINWSADTLRAVLRNDLKGEEVLIVSNREPYIHVRR